jgi:curved DNA-binding protein CbpA
MPHRDGPRRDDRLESDDPAWGDSMVAKRDLYRILQVDPDAHPTVITAAYRALARLRHPDLNGTDDGVQMADLNEAYQTLRDPMLRAAYDRRREVAIPVSAPGPSPAAPRPNGHPAVPRQDDRTRLDFGRYLGWSLRELARHDPDYLRWLRRHSSGIRYRREIDSILGATVVPASSPSPTRRR